MVVAEVLVAEAEVVVAAVPPPEPERIPPARLAPVVEVAVVAALPD